MSRITMTDARRVYCVAGIRQWFSRHDLDFRAFVRDGIDAADLPDPGVVERILEARRKAEEMNDGR